MNQCRAAPAATEDTMPDARTRCSTGSRGDRPGEIADGVLADGQPVPASSELAGYHRTNRPPQPTGINILADDGLLDKRRGIGMFVAAGAARRLPEQRRKPFAEQYPALLLGEATMWDLLIVSTVGLQLFLGACRRLTSDGMVTEVPRDS